MLQTKTHFEQVPIELVKRIVEEQSLQEAAVKGNRDGGGKSFELEVWEALVQADAKFHPFSQEDKKPS